MDKDKDLTRMKKRLARVVPESEDARLREFATDIAIGESLGAWEKTIHLIRNQVGDEILRWTTEGAIGNYEIWQMLMSKWTAVNLPDYQEIYNYGYFISLSGEKFNLSTMALELPTYYADIFISYKRSESSAFALLMESRIKQDTDSTPFLDKELDAGDKWHAKLEEKIAACEIFICLLAPGTLISSQVRREIDLAIAEYEKKRCQIIPVWHKGYDKNKSGMLDKISDKFQAIVVKEESTAGYDFAVSEISYRLKYSVSSHID